MNLNAFSLVAAKPWLRKLLLVMKLNTLIILLAFLQCSAKSYSQTVNLNESNAPLKKVLQKISQQTGYVFFYDSNDVKHKNVTIHAENVPLNDVLEQCFRGASISFKVFDKTVVLKQIEKTDAVQSNTHLAAIITGTVIDDTDKPLPGVTVKVKGTNLATTTDNFGKFSLTAPDENVVLVFSFIGFQTQEIKANGNSQLAIKMLANVSGLNDVVVVGYGTQKKVDLTGSVSTVSGAVLNERATPNAANLLEGRIAGLDLVQASGQPGQDSPNFQVRGLGTFGAGAAPLILVDGVIVDNLNLVAGNDIESVSVLKDAASAAIYGNRAANGVILITTKRGKAGATTINYNNDFSLNQAARLPDLIWNSAEYMTDFNAAREHSGQTDIYTQAQIDAYKNAPANSKEYPNFNYLKYYMGGTSFSENHHISVNGGNENTTFNIAAGYLNQNGIIKNTNADRYNLLFSLDSKINKTFKVGATVSLSKQDIVEPWLSNDNLVLLIYQSAPTYAPFLPDGSGRIANNDFYDPTGTYGAGHNRSPEFTLDNGNVTTNKYEARAQTYLETKITKGLTWLVKGAFNYDDSFQKTYEYAGAEYYYHPDPTLGYVQTDNGNPPNIGIQDYDQRELYLNAYTTLNYKTTFAKNNHLSALGGYSVESDTYQYLYGQRETFPVNTLTQLNAGSVTGQNLAGDEYQYALQSFFGRINYDYKEKYLLELNGRDDGTSRISPSKRYGFFPSAAIGWRISEENFMKPLTWLDNLKIRASYGRLGNQNIGNYPYQALLTVTQYAYNSSSGVSQGVYQPTLTNSDIHWETTDVTDLGFDLDIKHGLFTATADYYNKKTSGILYTPVILQAIGLNAPTENSGMVQNRGFELDLGHANHIGNFRYSVDVLFALNRNKILQLTGGTEDEGMYINKVGQPYGSFYLDKWTGIFQSQSEIDNSAKETFASPKPGDLKYQDVNGDGKIDANDRQIVKGIFPDYTYSFKINFGYKNWDLTTFWQGVQGIKRFINTWGYDPFIQGSTPPTFFRNAWTPQNHSETVPALYTFGYAPDDGVNSTYFLKDASYLRLKNVRLTYHLTPEFAKRLLVKSASVFISSDNLLTFTKFPGDPERLQSGPYNPQTGISGQSAIGSEYSAGTRFAQYPQVRMFTAGLNVSF